ncbi:MAG: hypothetical protein Q8T08_14265 [Ignavibacteria bacterium]|nr:hypothetical protein [Ignavibacteria bacterium]
MLQNKIVEGQDNSIGKEPKSIHTWLDSDKSNLYNYDIDLCVVDFPSMPNTKWLYFFSLQVNFKNHNEWAHGGFQFADVEKFKSNQRKGVNWGGGSDWSGYGGLGTTNTPFTWELQKWYRYRVWRLPVDNKGFWHWEFWILDYETGFDKQFGTIRTKSEFINNACVWIETGYGVQCDTERAYVKWRNPIFRCLTQGLFSPNKGTATYNGTCEGANNTNQGLVSTDPLIWFQTTNSPRTVNNYENLWGN